MLKVTSRYTLSSSQPSANPKAAMEQAGLLGRNHVKRLNGVELGTMKIDTGENGVFWRVVTEPLPRAEADGLCSGLKRRGRTVFCASLLC